MNILRRNHAHLRVRRVVGSVVRWFGTTTTTPPREHAVEVIPRGTAGTCRVLFTCEHGGRDVPFPFRVPKKDNHLRDTHWWTDIGAASFVRQFASQLEVPAVLTSFTRLLIDTNRPLESPTLFREMADGRPVHLNQDLLGEEKQFRIAALYEPFHEAVREGLEADRPLLVVSLHSFSPVYEGKARDVEVGVLFHGEDDTLARMTTSLLRRHGFRACINEPWSGTEGYMYSATTHAHRIGAQALMLEFRNDLCVDHTWSRAIQQRLSDMLKSEFK